MDNINIKTKLSAIDFITFVNLMEDAEWITDEENEKMIFSPAYSEVLFVTNIIRFYTDANYEGKLHDIYDEVMGNGLYYDVVQKITDTEQYCSLYTCMRRAQEKYYSENTGVNKLINSVVTSIKNFDPNKFQKQIKDIVKKLSPEQLNIFSNALKTSNLFNNVPQGETDVNAFKQLMENISNTLPANNVVEMKPKKQRKPKVAKDLPDIHA